MSRATVTTFGRGVSFVASGETGTQANEFEAAIKSVTSATTVGAVFVYDTRNDSDGGAWRKKARGSWYYEDLNTATRGGRREFPSVALIVADNVSDTETLTIYDLDDVAAPLWLQITVTTQASPYHDFWRDGRDVTSIAALNGRLYFGTTESGATQSGLKVVDFVEDRLSNLNIGGTTQFNGYFDANVANRNSTTKVFLGDTFTAIAHQTVNDVAATVLEGAEIGALGLPIPTIAVATPGGVSVIHPNGSVYDIGSIALNKVWFTAENRIGMSRSTALSDLTVGPIPFADIAWSSYRSEPGVLYAYDGAAADFATVGTGVNAAVDGAIGQSNGLTLWRENLGNPEESLFAYITSSYNTGYMLGDIRFAGLSGSGESGDISADRSVKSHTLTKHGTGITDPVVATDAELRGITGFSASSYLSKASTTDFDFGTGDFSISLWVKNTNWTGTQRLLGRSQDSNTKRLSIYASGTTLYAYIKDTTTKSASADVLKNNVWQHVFAFRRGSVLYLFVDGKLVNSVTGADSINITPASNGMLVIGSETFDNGSTIESTALVNGSLSLVRISATAPTPTQVADIYREEAKLFRSGAKCLLQTGASATTNVQDLAYDSSTDLLTVGTGAANVASAGATIFRGLEAVDTFKGQDYGGWSTGTLTKVASNGGVSAYYRGFSTGGLVLDLPAIDVRGDLNTADSKLPDDGKFHFSGVTTNATPTVIGQIPIAEDEQLYIKSVVNAGKYRAKTSERASFEVDAQFVRKIGDDVNSPTELRKLSDETYSQTFDVVWERDTASNTARLKVTGVAGMRFEWSADITVQRISEKTYER